MTTYIVKENLPSTATHSTDLNNYIALPRPPHGWPQSFVRTKYGGTIAKRGSPILN